MSNKPVPIENVVIADGSRMGGAIKPQVASIRKGFGLTQAEFAKEVGVSRVTVARWEGGVSHPRPRDLEPMLKVVHRHLLDRAVDFFLAARDQALTCPKCGAMVAPSDTGQARVVDSIHTCSKEDEIRRAISERSGLSLKTEYWAVALLLGGDARMTLEQWRGLFNTTTDVLSGLPVAMHHNGQAFYWGYDVGLALEAAVRGQTYSQLVDATPDEEVALTFGSARLSSELLQMMGTFEIVVGKWPLLPEEIDQISEEIDQQESLT